jgi:HK97 family phage portal protein
MSLIQSLSRGALALRADVTGTPAAWDDYWYSPIGYSSASGQRVNPDSAKRIAAVLACVGVISRNVGMMPCKIYTEAADGSKKLVTHHPLYDVLYSRPNSQQTAFEFKQMMQGHLELRGNAYAEIKPGPRGAVDQLIPMHPDRVHVERILPSGKLRYRYDDPLTNTTRNLMEEEVFHLRNFSDDGAVGQSTVAMGVDVIGIALAQQDYVARFQKNDARPPIVFEGTIGKNKQQEDDFIESWQKGHTGANRGKAGVLPPGITAKILGVTPIDQQLLDSRKYSRLEICSMFGVPPHLIGEIEKTASYASVEQFNILYAVHCILPRLVMWEQAIQRDLLTSDKYFAKFSMSALLRGDTASRFNAYHVAIGDGWMCQDDVRALEDMNPLPNGIGRNFWRPVNWTMLSNTSLPVTSSPEPIDNAETTTEDPNAGVNDSADQADAAAKAANLKGQLQILAASAADRCVRKEVAALRRLVERNATDYQVEEFYASHRDFIAEVLNLDQERMTPVRQECFDRAGLVCGYLAAGDKAAAYEFIDRVAATESLRLAGHVTGGIQ